MFKINTFLNIKLFKYNIKLLTIERTVCVETNPLNNIINNNNTDIP